MKITMIGHAGLLVETSTGVILIDPWLFGSAFNNSLDLLEPSHIPNDLWSRVNWIWFSHEHPDHFHTESIKSIPVQKRNVIKVLFQNTFDKKLRNWMIKQGFMVDEINSGSFLELGTGCRIYLETAGIYDSWIMIEDQGEYFLDLNDCAILLSDLARISRIFPKVDVLMSQFGFAGWIGNPQDTVINKVAETYLKKLYQQIVAIKPVNVIPAASFIRFSHVDNSWMNQHQAKLMQAIDRINSAGALPIVLAPGDNWILGHDHNNQGAIRHYMELEVITDFPLHSYNSVDISEIQASALVFSKRLLSNNNIILLWFLKALFGFLRPISFWVKDISLKVKVDPLSGSLTQITSNSENILISIHSFALNKLLSQPSGIDTLVVSGLFESADGRLDSLHNSFNINSLNNAGIRIRFRTLLSWAVVQSLLRIAKTWFRWKKENILLRRKKSMETDSSYGS